MSSPQPFGMETSTFNVVTWIDLLQISRLGWKNTTRLSILHREFECKKTTMTWKVCAFCAKKGGKLHLDKNVLKTWKRRHDATSTRQLWDAGAKGWVSQFTNSQTELMWKINETHYFLHRRYIFKWFEQFHCHVCFPGGGIQYKTSLLQRIQTVPRDNTSGSLITGYLMICSLHPFSLVQAPRDCHRTILTQRPSCGSRKWSSMPCLTRLDQ